MEGIEKRLVVFRQRKVRPSVYAVFIDTGKQRILDMAVAFTIEEAQQMAAKKVQPDGTKQENWVMLTVYTPGDQLLKEMTELKVVKPIAKASSKNELMKEILNDERNIEESDLSEDDKAFLRDLINRKKQ
jgi:heterodisulfide reductase subunit C